MDPQTAPPTALDADALAALLVRSDLVALALACDDRVIFANAAFRRLFGRTDEMRGCALTGLAAPAHRDRVVGLLRGAVAERAACVIDVACDDGRWLQVELRARDLRAAGVALYGVFAQDVTDRTRSARHLNLLAFSDPLTGLANRARFVDRLAEAAAASRSNDGRFALIMLDLDHFKPVNDSLGHAAGDLALQQVAARLKACLRPGDTIARLGGDEFAVLLPGTARDTDAVRIAERMLAAIREPMTVDEHPITLDASAGFALFPEHGAAVERLIVAADMALYAAKRTGRSRVARAAQTVAEAASTPSITWSEAYALGIPAIDAQHKLMAALLDELAAALRNGQDPQPPFRSFLRYVALHFADEECLMARCRYAAMAEHADLHRRLLADVAALRLEGEGFSASAVLRYLQEWLLRHIDGSDRDMAMAIRCEAGAAAAGDETLPAAV